MSTIGNGELRDFVGASDPQAILRYNLEVLDRQLYSFLPSFENGDVTDVKGPPTDGDYNLSHLWRDALGAEYVCTVAGSPGTWTQLRPAIVDERPTGIPSGYLILRRDSDWRAERYNGSGWDVLVPLNNRSASTAPGVGDDDADGYEVGSRWWDTTADKEYVCLDASTGAAVWVETTAGASGGESNTASNVGAGAGLFKTKSGVDLQFYSLESPDPEPGSSGRVLEYGLDAPNNLIQLVATWSNLRLSDIDGDHASTHLQGGVDEIEGRDLQLTYSGSLNYTPTTGGGTIDPNQLGSHLAGISQALAQFNNLDAGNIVIGTVPAARLPDLVGDSGSGGTRGAAPAPAAGDASAGKFLKADGTWAIPSGSGSGDVSGPASAVSGNIATFDGTTGKLIQDGGNTIAALLSRTNHTGTQTLSTISDAGTAAALDVPASGDAAAGEVVKGNDSRLSDARTPTTHGHTLSDVSDAGTAASLDVPAAGDAAAGEVVKGSDSRLTNSRTPTAHTHTLSEVTDAGTAAGLDVPASGDAAAGEVVKGNDTRLTDARTPTAHTHTLSAVTDAGTSAGLNVAESGNAADGEVVKGSDTRLKEGAITVTIGDGVNAITAGTKALLAEMPYAGTITGWTLVSDASGSIVIDVWKDTYANIPPTIADTIAGSEKPTLSSAQKNQDLSLSTWTTSLAKGDSLIFNVDSAATVTRVSLVLRIAKS